MKKALLKTILLSCCLYSSCPGQEAPVGFEEPSTFSHKQLKLPMGDDFKTSITESDVFVDKTLFIKEILDSGEEAILITRPRRWGKSMSLSMLRYFFNREVDQDGKALDPQPHGVLFAGGQLDLGADKGGKKTLSSLKIAQDSDWESKYRQAQGQYPVIFLSFKDAKSREFLQAKKFIGQKIYEAYHSHKYLAKSIVLQEDDRNKFKRRLDAYGALDEPSVEESLLKQIDLKDSLKFLTELLHSHHKKKAYILIDEYDKPVNFLLEDSSAFSALDTKGTVQKLGELISSILSECGKTNTSLEKFILTGIFDTLKKEGHSGLTNLNVHGIQDERFSLSYGFSEKEIKTQLLSKFNFQEQDSVRIFQNIKDWYNGYEVPVYMGTLRLYTPWAVNKYLSSASLNPACKPQNYWASSGTSTILQSLLKNDLGDKLKNKLLGIAIDKPQYLDFNPLISLLDYEEKDYQKTEKLISYLLLNSGYLTVREEQSEYVFYIPNYEVKQEFVEVVQKRFKESNLEGDKMHTYLSGLYYALQYYKQTMDIFDAIVRGDLQKINSIISLNNKQDCTDPNLNFNFLHMAALLKNQEVFNKLLSYCGETFIDKKDPKGLGVADYAFLSGNNTAIQKTTTEAQSIRALSFPYRAICWDYGIPTLAAMVGALGGGVIDKKYLAGRSMWWQIGVPAGLAGVGAFLGTLSEKYIKNYCTDYTQYYAIDVSNPESFESINQMQKYLLEKGGRVVVNNQCNNEEREVTTVKIPAFSYDKIKFNFTLCAQKIIDL